MLDTKAVELMIQQQIEQQVNDQVLTVLTSDQWIQQLEQKILKYTQDRILGKFANVSAIPDLVETVKNSVTNLFDQGLIPGIEQYVEHEQIKQAIDQAVTELIDSSVQQLTQDSVWVSRVEHLINQAVTQRTVATLGSIDLNPIIRQRVDENMKIFQQQLLTKFASTGIDDQATSCQLTVMDDQVVIENQLTAREIDVVGSITTNNLSVKGAINVNNQSWQNLADVISEKTLLQITEQWTDTLVDQVKTKIQDQGIAFEQVKIGENLLVDGNRLSSSITDSKIQSLGQLKELNCRGPAYINNNTLNVLNRRLGINTQEPEMALSVWDEEVSVTIGKFKSKHAWVGTNREQGLTIGVNRSPQIEISEDGWTTIKQLRVGLHKISHATQMPGWSGVRGDLVINTNPGQDRVFAWMCLGGHKWQAIKSAE